MSVFKLLLASLLATSLVANSAIRTNTSAIKVLVPPSGEKAYKIAGETFADMWEKVTGERPSVSFMEFDEKELPVGDIVLIGSDAVNPAVHELIRSGTIDGLGLQYGGDNYRLLSLNNNCLIVAGGSGRSTIYAVYDFFRKQAGVEYFWDGDVIPHHDQIEISGIDVLEQPHFQYRGLRYFAHRGLHRFQAEHWDLDDWKREIDWLMKKRFNLFMLRTGIDDLFQRAFPDDVSYPPVDGQDPDAEQRSYNDRTSFWSLKYRGELRKKVLEYARDRGLLHPEDIGTITHWYSHTPGSFYKSNPDFPVITNQRSGYSLPTQAIWDIEKQETWDAYWKLTETHIREFGGGSPRMFHTIGLAERTFGSTDRENLQMKLYVYRKTQQRLRENYPDAPLLIASWDFIKLLWTDEKIQKLFEEFDPNRTILLDYTADKEYKVTYRDWGVYKKFPWIFGVFHSWARNSDIHNDYSILNPRLREAAADSMCVGMVMWPEISHSDTYFLEYLADNSWNPDKPDIDEATAHYCDKRYTTVLSNEMKPVWESFLPLSQSLHFDHARLLAKERQWHILNSNIFTDITPEIIADFKSELQRIIPALPKTSETLRGLAVLTEKNYDNSLWRRDVLDMARTIASRALFASLAQGAISMEGWRLQKVGVADIRQLAGLSQELLACLSDILSMSDDFSMYASLQRLYNAEQIEGFSPMVNPHSEQTLKANAENSYCRNQQYELVEYVYRPEMEIYWEWVLKRVKSDDRSVWKRPQEFTNQQKIIKDRFYETPLTRMAPKENHNANDMAEILLALENLVKGLLDETSNFN